MDIPDEYEDAIAEWCEHRDAPGYKWRDDS